VGVVNGFHVHAVGWVLACNARALRPQEAHELSELWAALVRARAEDRSRAHPLIRLLQPRSIPLSEHSAGAFADLVERMGGLDRGDIYSMVLQRVEKPLITLVLKKTEGNQVRAASLLGINRNTLRKKIKELGIKGPIEERYDNSDE